MYLTQALHRMLRNSPDAVATIEGDQISTWRETAERVARFAGMLLALGMQPGERVALLSRNRTHYLDYVLGTFWAGGVINPVNLRWSAREIGSSLTESETRLLIVEPEFAGLAEKLRGCTPDLERIVSTSADAGWADAPMVDDALRNGTDLAAIMYTGGTTGQPKGVMLSHANLAASAIGSLAVPRMAPGPVFLHSAPLFHIGALSGMLIALFGGSTHAFLPAFEPEALMETVAQARVHDIFFVPTMLRMILDHPRFAAYDLSSIGHIRYGASPMDETLLDRAMAAFPGARFSQAYGMTELSPIATLLAPADHGAAARANGKLRSAGQATPVVEIRVVVPDDEELPRGVPGEVVARGPTVMLGYWKRPEETAQALRGGWMHTGDIGHMGADGYLTVVDRLKDMIITGGENVYSAEVENIVAMHPAVAAVAVIGVPDAHWGERVHAVIVLRRDCTADGEAIRAHCRPLLAAYKIPRTVAFAEALPLSAAGKVLKPALRRLHLKSDG
jgi:acyl-CoA synthetase (AMP-forming)/AMP-acid ligase II